MIWKRRKKLTHSITQNPGIELETKQPISAEEPISIQIKKYFQKNDYEKIADICIKLLEEQKSNEIANVLNQLLPNEKKILMSKWREKSKTSEGGPVYLLLAAYFTPLPNLISDKEFLKEIKKELNENSIVVEENNGVRNYTPNKSSPILNILARKVDARIAITENPNINTNLIGIHKNDIGLNLEGLDVLKIFKKKNINHYRLGLDKILFTEQVDFSHLNLQNAHCRLNAGGANLSHAYFTNSNLTGSYFKDATLTDVHAQKADLSESNLTNANCSHADFRGAKLTKATLRGANLNNANLQGADLRKVKWNASEPDMIQQIMGANLFGAVLDDNTKDYILLGLKEDAVYQQRKEFKPFQDYFKNSQKAPTSTLRSLFSKKPSIDKHLAVLYLMGATTREEFDKRYHEIPEKIKESKFTRLFSSAADQVRENLPSNALKISLLQGALLKPT